MNFKPLADRVLVQKDAKKDVTQSGLFIPDNSKQVVTEGVVLGVGSAVTELEVGDRVMFGPRAGTEITLFGEKVFVFREEDIWGVFG
jgi:chaperonin GroES